MDSVAQDLFQQGGYSLVPLSSEQQQTIQKGFETGRSALDKIQQLSTPKNVVRCISDSENSAHATGYHSAGGMSKYNSHREGFVFSDGGMFSTPIQPDLEESMVALQQCLHGMANRVLNQIEQQLELPTNWFSENYQHDQDYSQWHLKRYLLGSNQEESETVLLPSHTDPSLLSIVVLDAPGKVPGAMGLQVYSPTQKEWNELPFHGHAVATVFVGSVLSYVTGGRCPSIKHRVVQRADCPERMAATFFLRPKASAILRVPPSPLLKEVSLKKETTFLAWTERVSRNYQQSKRNQS